MSTVLAPSTSNGGWTPPLGVRFTCVPGTRQSRPGILIEKVTRCSCCKSRGQRSDRYVTLELPLFPGYLFCRCAEPRISSVLNTCVLRVLATRESPGVVNEEEIRYLATRLCEGIALDINGFVSEGSG
jgi:hypothetical protein